MNVLRTLSIAAAMVLLNGASAAQPQVDLPTALVKSSRVVILPFANYSGAPGIKKPLLRAVREWMQSADVEVVDSAHVAAVLRAERIRNALELSVAELQTLSSELDAAYVLTGAAHRLIMTEDATEFSLVAYLVYVPEARIDWCGSATVAAGGPVSVFTRGSLDDTSRVIEKAVRRLFRDFDFSAGTSKPTVSAVKRDGEIIPCTRVALVPLSNETSTPNAGEFVTDHLAVALLRRGFTVVLPGRTREAMLQAGDLTRGQTSAKVVKSLAASGGVDMILTGSVSGLTSAGDSRFGDIPELSMELRLIRAADNHIVWAEHFTRSGASSLALFGAGVTTATGALTEQACRAAVRQIPAVRKKAQSS